MRKNRESYPKAKAQMYEQATALPSKYSVTALVRMEKVRASQVLLLRKKLKGQAEFFSIKNRVVRKALEGSGVPGIKDVAGRLAGQCMFMFTDMSPFKLSVLLSKNKIMMAARGGDTASIDVVVPAKNTGVAPGPMLTDFKEAGIPTKIDQGTIWITKDTVPVKAGQAIPEKLAALLAKLDIKPVEAGISLAGALEGGVLFEAADLAVDTKAVGQAFSAAAQEALSLAVETAYFAPESAQHIVSRASGHASALASTAGYVTADTAGQVLARATAQAAALASAAKYEAS